MVQLQRDGSSRTSRHILPVCNGFSRLAAGKSRNRLYDWWKLEGWEDASVREALLPVSGVDPDGDRPVVGQGNLHVGAEDAGGDGLAEFLGECQAEGFV